MQTVRLNEINNRLSQIESELRQLLDFKNNFVGGAYHGIQNDLGRNEERISE